jgi:hypothetical protein
MDIRFIKPDCGYVECLPVGGEPGEGVRLQLPWQVTTIDGTVADFTGATDLHLLTGAWQRTTAGSRTGRTLVADIIAVTVSLRPDQFGGEHCDLGLVVENISDDPLRDVAATVVLEPPDGPRRIEIASDDGIRCIDGAGRSWMLTWGNRAEGPVVKEDARGSLRLHRAFADVIPPGGFKAVHGTLRLVRPSP